MLALTMFPQMKIPPTRPVNHWRHTKLYCSQQGCCDVYMSHTWYRQCHNLKYVTCANKCNVKHFIGLAQDKFWAVYSAALSLGHSVTIATFGWIFHKPKICFGLLKFKKCTSRSTNSVCKGNFELVILHIRYVSSDCKPIMFFTTNSDWLTFFKPSICGCHMDAYDLYSMYNKQYLVFNNFGLKYHWF